MNKATDIFFITIASIVFAYTVPFAYELVGTYSNVLDVLYFVLIIRLCVNRSFEDLKKDFFNLLAYIPYFYPVEEIEDKDIEYLDYEQPF